tara:strand:+ start:7 stop:537 length:531 start_codon:yes stop_codon:yes gene_type:complete
MTKKLEETFNLPPLKDVLNHSPQDALAEAAAKNGHDPNTTDVAEINVELTNTLAIADKIDNALPEVTGMESLDRDMDAYASKAMETFDTLVDLGHNMEDRHAANVFDVASKMMKNAIEAKTAKLDKKLRMIELQIRKAKLDTDKDPGETTIIPGEGHIVTDRNAILDAIANRIKDK